MKARLKSCWRFLRQLATDDAYERYLEQHRQEPVSRRPLSRRAFYLQQQQHKWDGVQRCC